ncbi:WbqC family protein [Paucisalibacillus sp. EB02]|uniref:WbqC family protein n=1 Tax=Paucisalibacillus sp. EB02 TaxID=1347087 RepID=UPI0004B29BB1|nr:WbqC family protein [Paucisalibacillus sp. EB02]
MKLGIMQPYFFPYIGYWQLINLVDKYVIYDDVNYIKKGWINRNKILMYNKDIFINLPIHKSSQNKYINELSLSNDIIDHKKKLLKTIRTCYNNAPYFNEVYSIVEDIVTNNDWNLASYLQYSIQKVCEFLSIDTEIIVSSNINKNNYLEGQDKIIEICEVLKAKEYINAIGGRDLYTTNVFNDKDIKIKFLQTENIEYQQFGNKFIPNLSIIDVMMFNSREQISGMLNNYSLR